MTYLTASGKTCGPGLWTAAQFRELDRASIPVFILQGNHDAASKVPHAIAWPANVQVFSVKKPQKFSSATCAWPCMVKDSHVKK